MKRKTMVALAIVTIVMAAAIVALLNQSLGGISEGAKIYVDPPIVMEETRQPPFTFHIYIAVYNVTNMVSCEFNMSYTPGIFVLNQINKIKVQDQYPALYTNADDVKGYVHVKLTYGQPITLLGESAQLLDIEFTAINYGSTTLDLHDVLIKDKDGNTIPCTVEDGFVWIIKHDIAIIDCIVSTNATYVNRLVYINVTAKNEGNIAENITIKICANDQIIATPSIANLGSGETVTVAVTWNTSSCTPSLTPYQIKAEADQVPYETNLTNNIFIDGNITIKIVGDVNGDGTVDIEDLGLWDAAYGSSPSDPNWNSQADINGDGVVDKEDGILIIRNYKSSLAP
ncbi:MAG: CARDB domain-containing protein [Candidatus Bathyarchaeia archaeon]